EEEDEKHEDEEGQLKLPGARMDLELDDISEEDSIGVDYHTLAYDDNGKIIAENKVKSKKPRRASQIQTMNIIEGGTMNSNYLSLNTDVGRGHKRKNSKQPHSKYS